MSAELFQEYRFKKDTAGIHAPTAAAQLSKENIKRLAAITGGIAVSHKVRGGSMVMSEIILDGMSAHLGDWVLAIGHGEFLFMENESFEENWALKGPMRRPVS